MARVKRGVTSRAKHKKVLNASGLSYAISAKIFLSNFIPDLLNPLINFE